MREAVIRVVALSLAVALGGCDDESSDADVGSSLDGAVVDDMGPGPAPDADQNDMIVEPDAGDGMGGADMGRDDMGPGDDMGAPAAYAPCARDTRVGAFTIELADDFTAVQGQVADAVNPNTLTRVASEEGVCALLRPRELVCDEACGGGTTCGPDGVCVAIPANVDVGEVTVGGLTAAVSMTASAPVWYYTFRGDLPHPGVMPGSAVALAAAGHMGEAFALDALGVEPIVIDDPIVELAVGEGAVIEWPAPAADTGSRVHLDLNIANHGGTPARIECDVPDTGRFELPVALTDELLGLGASGFPTVVVTRRSVDSAEVALGCVELRVISQTVLDVEIPGLTSCGADEDCPMGQTCQDDLTCG